MGLDLKIGSLFSGIEGFGLGLERVGVGKVIWVAEIDKHASAVLRYHFKGVRNYGDTTAIRTANLPDADIITFGWPCQDNSIAGKRKGHQKGKRSSLLKEALRIIKAKNPKMFIAENVTGLFSVNNGYDFIEALLLMASHGYMVDFDVQNTSWYLPQNRERIYFIGINAEWTKSCINEDIRHGRLTKKSLYEQIIHGYLLTLWQRNLGDQQRPQDHTLNKWVLDYLITQKQEKNGLEKKKEYLRKILTRHLMSYHGLFQDIQNTPLRQNDTSLDLFGGGNPKENKTDIKYNTKTEERYQNTELSLDGTSEENSMAERLSTISTLTGKTMESVICSCAETEAIIENCILKLKDSFPGYWKKALSNLIERQENIKYAEIRRNEGKNKSNDLSGQLRLPDTEGFRDDAIGHLRGQRRPEVFPIREDDTVINGSQRKASESRSWVRGNYPQTANTISRRYHKDGSENLIQVGNVDTKGHNSIWGRVYDPKGMSATISSGGGGLGAKTGLYAVPVLTPNRPEKRQNGRRFKEDGEPMFTLTGQDQHGVMVQRPHGYNNGGEKELPCLRSSSYEHNEFLKQGTSIRRLTPRECERLQGFPDDWTLYGDYGDGTIKEISDTQRYKMCGNAVTVDVVEVIGRKLKQWLCDNQSN